MSETFNKLMASLATRIGLPSLSTTQDGIYDLFFDDLPLTFQYLPENDSLLLFSSLGKLPDQGREELCLKLLEANHFFSGTAGATLSAHRSTGLVGLHQVVPMQILDEARFLQILEAYMNTAEQWAKVCAKADTPEPKPTGKNLPGAGWMPA